MDINKLTPLSLEAISRQATMNIEKSKTRKRTLETVPENEQEIELRNDLEKISTSSDLMNNENMLNRSEDSCDKRSRKQKIPKKLMDDSILTDTIADCFNEKEENIINPDNTKIISKMKYSANHVDEHQILAINDSGVVIEEINELKLDNKFSKINEGAIDKFPLKQDLRKPNQIKIKQERFSPEPHHEYSFTSNILADNFIPIKRTKMKKKQNFKISNNIFKHNSVINSSKVIEKATMNENSKKLRLRKGETKYTTSLHHSDINPLNIISLPAINIQKKINGLEEDSSAELPRRNTRLSFKINLPSKAIAVEDCNSKPTSTQINQNRKTEKRKMSSPEKSKASKLKKIVVDKNKLFLENNLEIIIADNNNKPSNLNNDISSVVSSDCYIDDNNQNPHVLIDLTKELNVKQGKDVKTRLSNKSHSSRKKYSQVEYEVEKLIDHKLEQSKIYYKVKWRDYPEEDCTWESLNNLLNSSDLVVNYWSNLLGDNNYKKDINLHVTMLKEEIMDKCCLDEHNWMRLNLTVNGSKQNPISQLQVDKLFKLIVNIPPGVREPEVLKIIEKYLFHKKMETTRRQQLNILSRWEIELNQHFTSRNRIYIENVNDLEGPPNFTFIKSNVISTVEKPTFVSLMCTCEGNCDKVKKCKCLENVDHKPYTVNGTIKIDKQRPVVECGKNCPCGPNCETKIVQKGRQIPLCLFKTLNGTGWGLKAVQDIPKGQFVEEYVGEIISYESSLIRGKKYDREKQTYLFDLDFENPEPKFTIDSYFLGNISRFFNHSCSPNMVVYSVYFADEYDPDLPHLALFTNKFVRAGEELTFDYLCRPLDSDSRSSSTGEKFPCKCGSHICRKTLF